MSITENVGKMMFTVGKIVYKRNLRIYSLNFAANPQIIFVVYWSLVHWLSVFKLSLQTFFLKPVKL